MSKEALEGSIKKWERIVKSTKAFSRGTSNCPLCDKYYHLNCKGCPVHKITGKDDCKETPFWEWQTHLMDVHSNYAVASAREPHCKECLRLTKKELAFLESLRTIHKEAP